jgi:hypothetical protein
MHYAIFIAVAHGLYLLTIIIVLLWLVFVSPYGERDAGGFNRMAWMILPARVEWCFSILGIIGWILLAITIAQGKDETPVIASGNSP